MTTRPPETMDAVIADGRGGPEVLRVARRPVPIPGPGEVLVRTRATAVNRADLLQAQGHYPPPPGVTDVLGLEFAGEVAAVGEGVEPSCIGDRVMAIVPGGGCAQYVAVRRDHLLPVPGDLAWAAAAATPEAFLTAFQSIVRLGGAEAGDTVLVHAAASGVGSAGVQIAREVGARVIATSRHADRLARARQDGADVLVVGDGRFADAVRDLTDGRGVDVVLDLVGAAYWADNVRSLARLGRLVLTGMVGGRRTELDLGPLYAAHATVIATTLRSRPTDEKAALVAEFTAWGVPRLADGRLVPVVDRVLPLADVADAHRAVAENAVVGKVVLTTD